MVKPFYLYDRHSHKTHNLKRRMISERRGRDVERGRRNSFPGS